MSVFVIVVNYNSGTLLKKCVCAIEQQSVKPERVIIVDNNSTDGSFDSITSDVLELKLIPLKDNYGFAKANNIALEESRNSQFVALLNPDAFPQSDWLENLLLAAKQNPNYSFFASHMLDANNPEIIDGQGDAYHISGLAWREGHGKKLSDTLSHKQAKEIFAACAGAALYRTEDMRRVNGFDEDFFCYMEDVDLSFRLVLAGKKGLYIPNAIVHHIGSAITGKKSAFSIYYGHRNLVWVFFKNLPLGLLIILFPLHLALNLSSIFYFMVKNQGQCILKAKFDALKGLPKILKKRTIIQRNRVVSSAYLFSLMSKKLNIFKK